MSAITPSSEKNPVVLEQLLESYNPELQELFKEIFRSMNESIDPALLKELFDNLKEKVGKTSELSKEIQTIISITEQLFSPDQVAKVLEIISTVCAKNEKNAETIECLLKTESIVDDSAESFDPEDPLSVKTIAYLDLAQAHMRLNNLNSAERLLKKAVDNNLLITDEFSQIKSLPNIAFINALLKNFDKARTILQETKNRALELAPNQFQDMVKTLDLLGVTSNVISLLQDLNPDEANLKLHDEIVKASSHIASASLANQKLNNPFQEENF